jgi:NADH-quinone oxidoreductase subunit N
MNPIDYYNTISLLSITVSALFLLGVEIIVKGKSKMVFYSSVILIILNVVISIFCFNITGKAFNEMLFISKFSNIFTILLLAGLLLTVLYSKNYIIKAGYDFGEFYILLFFAFIGMILMVSANDLIIVFLGIEVMSIPFYILAGFFRKRIKSNESSLKYFLLGAFATGFLLYGIALIYGVSATTNMPKILTQVSILKTNLLFTIGLGLLLVGVSFKIAAFPFHSYAPDVYEGAPATISGFFSSMGKVSAFGLLILISSYLIDKDIVKIKEILTFISVASMIIGSLVAIVQKNIKRMLAYSSISHAGYILIGIIVHSAYGYSAVIYYSIVYVFMQLSAFGIVAIVESENGDRVKIQDYNGLSHKNPILAFFLAIMMLSLAGIPPFGGFFGKYYIFLSAVQADMTWLAITGALVSVVSVYFYLNVIQSMYFKEANQTSEIKMGWPEYTGLIISLVVLLITGIMPDFLIKTLHNLF